MFSFVQNWFNASSNPIGVDFGSDCLRMAQVEESDNEHRLVAAGSADVPPHVRNEPLAKFNFFCDTARDLLAQGGFRGRRVRLNLPASLMHIQHLRLPKMDEEALKKALPWECRGKFPFDPSQALIRHLIAGEIYHDQEPKFEIVAMAARRDLVDQYLAAAAKARLDVVGMTVEPMAVADCFSHIFRRKQDTEIATLFVDIGCTATRTMIAKGGKIQFARVIPIGGEHFSRAVASALQISLDQSRLLRIKLAELPLIGPAIEAPVPASPAAAPASASNDGGGFALLTAAVSAGQKQATPAPTSAAAPQPAPAVAEPIAPRPAEPAGDVPTTDRQRVEQACREPLTRLIEELALCRRYYEATFPNQPVQRLIFIGGEAHQRAMCQQIARGLGVAANVGDPLARLSKATDVGIESGIDRRSPQPAWTVALGLTLGAAVAEEVVK